MNIFQIYPYSEERQTQVILPSRNIMGLLFSAEKDSMNFAFPGWVRDEMFYDYCFVFSQKLL